MTKNIKTAKIEGDKIVINYSTKDNHPNDLLICEFPIDTKQQLYALKVMEKENKLLHYLQPKINL